MTDGFSELATALSALDSQRTGREVTDLAVAGTSTDGSTNQRIDLEPLGAPAVPEQRSGVADLDKTIVELQMLQMSYQAALVATERIITTSLADFLR
jgi:hypothetical protein